MGMYENIDNIAVILYNTITFSTVTDESVTITTVSLYAYTLNGFVAAVASEERTSKKEEFYFSTLLENASFC